MNVGLIVFLVSMAILVVHGLGFMPSGQGPAAIAAVCAMMSLLGMAFAWIWDRP